ncbi:pyridoxal phosphate-dependent aminotransferase [Gynurincola endophyticus]|uniref:pyridoxal phosphate-dependent aminotransferase n=1 Tax=Gynurincola endophyticus TaxID=2479004 RepID=UPI0037425274
MALLPGVLTSLKAAPRRQIEPASFVNFLTDEELARETTPPEIKARLSANENPFGPSPKAKQAIIEAIGNTYRYAFFEGRKMIELIAKAEALQPNQILLSAGSSALLQAGAMVYNSGTILSAQPTYEDLLSKAESMGTKVIRLPLTSAYKYDLDAIEKAIDATTSLIYICNPNNPTATLLDPVKLKSFCEKVSKKVPVFIDEAYIDLVEDPAVSSMMPLVKEGHNVIIVRTFSKLYGMAGMRFGYMVAQPETIKKFSALTPGSNSIASTTWAAAISSYEDKDFLRDAYTKIKESKEYLYNVLKEEGYTYIPSSANFVIFPVKEDSRSFATKMSNNGVSVRSWQFNNQQWCRVSIGTLEEMKAFALSLAKIS